MSLNTAWWAALGVAARWAADFGGYHDRLYSVDSGCWGLCLSEFPRCYLGPSSNSSGNIDTGLDSGFLYADNEFPSLLSLHLSVISGATVATITNSMWSHTGKIRYRIVVDSTGYVLDTSGYYPTSDGTSYSGAITLSGLTPGNVYRIEYWLDCTPDITVGGLAYVEQWWHSTVVFTAPTVVNPDVNQDPNIPMRIYAVQTAIIGGEFGTSWENYPQFIDVSPRAKIGDFAPVAGMAKADAARIVTPWIVDNPVPVGAIPWTSYVAIMSWLESLDGLWAIKHYQPWAYAGTPPALIAAIAMQAGLSSSWIDQTLFSDADDSYTNDAPWSSLSAVPVLYAARKIGRTVADLVYEVARHTRDLLAVTMSGKLAVVSRTDPPTLATLAYTDGVVAVEWGWTVDHLFNSVVARFCGGYAESGEPMVSPTGLGTFACNEEVNLDSHSGDKWDVTGDNAASQAKYGVVTLPGTKRSTIISGAIKERTVASYPFWLDVAVGDALLTHWLPMDAQPRREVRVRQTFLGLDYDVGTRISAVTLTGDGATVANMFCIEKEIDFDDLRVDSILLEDPSL